MRLAQWLQELGFRSARAQLSDVEAFVFGADAYVVKMKDGRTFQDNDLERMLSVIHDEFERARVAWPKPQLPLVSYPFTQKKAARSASDPLGQRGLLVPEMFVTPGEWTAPVPPPTTDLLVQQLRENVTYFNLTGQWTPPFKKDNL